MADEATIRSSLSIKQGVIDYRSTPSQFRGAVVGAKGPVPGAVDVDIDGTIISFAELTTPGYGRIMNLDSVNAVHYGIWDGTEFYPLHEVQAGEVYVFRMSRYFGRSFDSGTGTGTFDTGTYQLMVRSIEDNTVAVTIEVFEA